MTGAPNIFPTLLISAAVFACSSSNTGSPVDAPGPAPDTRTVQDRRCLPDAKVALDLPQADTAKADAARADGQVDVNASADTAPDLEMLMDAFETRPDSSGLDVPPMVDTDSLTLDAAMPIDAEVLDLPAPDTSLPDACIPDCKDKKCGKDGCGGECGPCENGEDCLEGSCTCLSAPSLVLEQTYGGLKEERINDVLVLVDGTIILAGHIRSKGAGDGDGWLLKTTAAGEVLWERTLGDSKFDTIEAVALLPDGGFALAGATRSKGAGMEDAWLVRTDGAGIALWDGAYGSAFEDWAADLAVTDQGITLVGWARQELQGTAFAQIVTTDLDGKLVDLSIVAGDEPGEFNAVTALNDQGYLAVGAKTDPQTGTTNAWAVRLDEAGQQIWEKEYGGAKDEVAAAVAQVNGGYAIAGATSSSGNGSWDFWLFVVDEQGEVMWEQTYGGKDGDFVSAMIPASDQGFLVLGQTCSKGNGDGDAWLVRTNSTGDAMWSTSFGWTGEEFPRSIAPAPGGGSVIAGETHSKGAGYIDGWLIKTKTLQCGCTPSCQSKVCGDDGCGGICGLCMP